MSHNITETPNFALGPVQCGGRVIKNLREWNKHLVLFRHFHSGTPLRRNSSSDIASVSKDLDDIGSKVGQRIMLICRREERGGWTQRDSGAHPIRR